MKTLLDVAQICHENQNDLRLQVRDFGPEWSETSTRCKSDLLMYVGLIESGEITKPYDLHKKMRKQLEMDGYRLSPINSAHDKTSTILCEFNICSFFDKALIYTFFYTAKTLIDQMKQPEFVYLLCGGHICREFSSNKIENIDFDQAALEPHSVEMIISDDAVAIVAAVEGYESAMVITESQYIALKKGFLNAKSS